MTERISLDALAAILISAIVACSPRPTTAPRFDTRDFRALRWLDGLWLDAGEGRTSYYERYQFDGDSVIRVTYYPGANLSRPEDGGRIVLRDGAIHHETPRSRSRVIRLDSGAVTFEEDHRSRRQTTWQRESPTSWVSSSRSSTGTPLVFRLERVAERAGQAPP